MNIKLNSAYKKNMTVVYVNFQVCKLLTIIKENFTSINI